MSNDIPRTHKSTAERHRRTNNDGPADDIGEYVRRNRELLARVLARGNTEAQGYALAAVANGGDSHDIEEIQQMLEDLKEEKQG